MVVYMKKIDLQFLFIGNNVTVDFINTEVISRGELIDLLPDTAALYKWAYEAGFKLKRGVNFEEFSTTLSLRQALKDVYLAKIDNRSTPYKALAILNQNLAYHSSQQTLQYDKLNCTYQLVPVKDTLTVLDLLGILAYEGGKLLASPQVDQLKHCCNADCILIFMDISRGQKRRWCSMETCGNRAKVATHYRNTAT
jgi:predicted RNA-binding Zn ribbon-like protein